MRKPFCFVWNKKGIISNINKNIGKLYKSVRKAIWANENSFPLKDVKQD